MRIRRLLAFSSLIFSISIYVHCSPACRAQSVGSSRVDVRLVTDEADAVLTILAKRNANQAIAPEDWQRLFSSEGYTRLKRRETSMQRSFADEEFRAFVLSDKLAASAQALAETQWSDVLHQDVVSLSP